MVDDGPFETFRRESLQDTDAISWSQHLKPITVNLGLIARGGLPKSFDQGHDCDLRRRLSPPSSLKIRLLRQNPSETEQPVPPRLRQFVFPW